MLHTVLGLRALGQRAALVAHPEGELFRRMSEGHDLVPLAASGEIDLLAKEYGLSVLKTRDNHLALMEAAADKQNRFVGGTKGGFIYNDFLFASDGMYSVAKLLECLAQTRKHLGELDRETPHLHLVKKAVPCSWSVKGRVMRHLMKDSERIQRELIDGVKIFPRQQDHRTSVLLNPDRTRPLFHINAESEDLGFAESLAGEYAEKLQQWINNE